MAIAVKDAYFRITQTLACGGRVFLTDGTVTISVEQADWDPEWPANKWLTLHSRDYSPKHLEGDTLGILQGVDLRDTKDYLLIGPDWYILKWPCDCTACVALYQKYCSVANCRGPVCNIPKTGMRSAHDAASAYLKALPLEKCFMPEHSNAYPLCTGNGADYCNTCCIFEGLEPSNSHLT